MMGYFLHEYYLDDFTYSNIEIENDERENIVRFFYNCINYIEKSKVCFVHCKVGQSLSAFIVISYVMYKFKLNYKKSYKYVKERKSCIIPNEGFILQLQDLNKVLKFCNYDLEKYRQIHKQLFKMEIKE